MDNLNTNTLSDASDYTGASTDGGVSVQSQDDKVAEFHTVVNNILGKNFPTPEAAAKALKDTFNDVGWAGKFKPHIDKLKQIKGGEEGVLRLMEQLTQEQPTTHPANNQNDKEKKALDESKFVSREQYDEDLWFSAHKELEGHRTLLRALKKETNKSFDELLEHPELKPLLAAKVALEKNTGSKSVLHSNTLVNETSTDYEADFKKAQETGDWIPFLNKHKGFAVPQE